MNIISVKFLTVPGQAPASLRPGELALNVADTPPTLYGLSATHEYEDQDDIPDNAVVPINNVTVSLYPPVSPIEGSLWLTRGTANLYIYHEFRWLPISQSEATGAVGHVEQDLGDVSGDVTVDRNKGWSVLMRVTGAVTSFDIIDDYQRPADRMTSLFVTDGSDINWKPGVFGWLGPRPVPFPAGQHFVEFDKTSGAWLARYIGQVSLEERPFMMTIRVPNDGDTFQIGGAYGTSDIKINWGDGTESTSTTRDTSHVYAKAGVYRISITGQKPGFQMDRDPASARMVESIDAWGDIPFTTMRQAFRDCVNLVSYPAGDNRLGGDLPDSITTYEQMFANTGLVRAPTFRISPTATTVRGLFLNCSDLIEIGDVVAPGATSWRDFARDCPKLERVGNLVTTSATSIEEMFSRDAALKEIPIMDTRNVRMAQKAFLNCGSITQFPKLDWSSMSNADGFVETWNGCSNLASFPARSFDTVTQCGNFNSAFGGTSINPVDIQQILVSLDNSGMSAASLGYTPVVSGSGTTPGNDAVTTAAIASLQGKGWTVNW